jgi:8-hydroxy-5-deazaflavin:NADPH oxidoreductase
MISSPGSCGWPQRNLAHKHLGSCFGSIHLLPPRPLRPLCEASVFVSFAILLCKSSFSVGVLVVRLSYMKVAILGSGDVGQTLGAGFLKHGHQVMMGTRNPKKEEVVNWVKETPGATAGTFAEAASFGELIVLAVLGKAVESVVQLAGPTHFKGKTLVDATNPITDAPPVEGVLGFTTGPNESAAEALQALLPDARVVKAFNSVGAGQMINPHYEQGVPTMFLCGNDEAAKKVVSDVIRQFGWEPFDCGTIISARALEPLCILWCLPGFRQNLWTHAFKVLTH